MEINDKIGVITGAGSGIGQAVALELARRKVRALALVDRTDTVDAVAAEVNALAGTNIARAFQGDVTDEAFRASVFDSIGNEHGPVTICIPAAGII